MSAPTWATECDDFSGVSSYNNHLPEQGSSVWKFKVPANTQSWIDIITDKADFSYGVYEVRFRATGGHIVDIYCPLFTISPNMGASSPYSELDFIEMFGGRGSRQIAITSWYPNPSSMDGTGDYDATHEFEDGGWHVARFKWDRNGEVTQWLDDVLQRKFTPKPENQTKPPVRLVANITNNSGANPTDFEMDIDYIRYWEAQPSRSAIFHGSMLESYNDSTPQTSVEHFASVMGKGIAIYDSWVGYPDGWNVDWSAKFTLLKPLCQNGTIKAVSLAWIPHLSDSDLQTQKDIPNGVYDAYINTIADECKAFGFPVYIRFGGEMNLCQSQSGTGRWGDIPTDFKASWIYVYNKFKNRGVTNVIWVWNPNCQEGDVKRYHWTDYYPGDAYVDWVGIDLYQFDDTADWCRPENLIKGIYDDYASKKPISINEWATNSYFMRMNDPNASHADTSDSDQAQWMTEFFDAIEKRPNIKWISYYYTNTGHWKPDGGVDWNGVSYGPFPQTLNIYKSRIANSIYVDDLNMSKKTGNGSLSAQAKSGEIVTIGITKPDGTIETILAQTDSSGKFTAVYEGEAGTYNWSASIPEDEKYLDVTITGAFTITKEARTMTLVWT